MIVCHCNVVRADEVRDEVSNGASSVRDIVAGCGVGGDCGGCLPRIEALITSSDATGRCAGANVRS